MFIARFDSGEKNGLCREDAEIACEPGEGCNGYECHGNGKLKGLAFHVG